MDREKLKALAGAALGTQGPGGGFPYRGLCAVLVDDWGGGGLFGAEGPKRKKVVGVFPREGSRVNLATVVMLSARVNRAFRRYLDTNLLWAAEEKPAKIAT
jgi:hypothetical protein